LTQLWIRGCGGQPSSECEAKYRWRRRVTRAQVSRGFAKSGRAPSTIGASRGPKGNRAGGLKHQSGAPRGSRRRCTPAVFWGPLGPGVFFGALGASRAGSRAEPLGLAPRVREPGQRLEGLAPSGASGRESARYGCLVSALRARHLSIYSSAREATALPTRDTAHVRNCTVCGEHVKTVQTPRKPQ